MEADLVSYRGGLGQGAFIYSLNLTDIFSGWVETQAVMGRGQWSVLDALFMNLFQPSVKLLRTVRTGSRKKRIHDEPQTSLNRLIGFGDLQNKRREELKALRQRLDPFCLYERVSNRLEQIWDLAHYRYQPPEQDKSAEAEPGQLSPEEREALEVISQAFGVTVSARTHPGGELVAIPRG